MKVKTIYMDLHEWVKKGNVWTLESEAFKKPIKVEICYDEEDKQFFDDKMNEVYKARDKYISLTDKLEAQIDEKEKELAAYENMLCRYEEVIWEYEKQLEQKDNELSSLLKLLSDLKRTSEIHSWAILNLQNALKLITTDLSKQPVVIHDKCFISGREDTGLWMIDIPDGKYLMIMNIEIWEHNEYVTNCNQLLMDKISVEWQHYIPFYKLEWGTELDTPTATIYYDLLFIPII